MISIHDALGAYVQAYCRGKSRTHPYLPERYGNLWIQKDGPGRKRDPRKIEVMAYEISPEETVRRVQERALAWHFIEFAHDAAQWEAVRREFRALGYRALATRWLFGHDLSEIPMIGCSPPVRHVESQEMLDGVRQRAGQPWRWSPDWRLYGVWDEECDRGWVTSVPSGRHAWTSSLHVHEDFRRQGYGSALMSKLLQDDKNLGFESNVLLAGVDGSKLYPRLGFKELATIQAFCLMQR
jgi:GNAT superfamily N-acetyltransferase